VIDIPRRRGVDWGVSQKGVEEMSFKDFLDGMSGIKTNGSASNNAGLDFHEWRQGRVSTPYLPPSNKVNLDFSQNFPTPKVSHKKAKVPPAPLTPEERMRSIGKWLTCATTIGIIYLCATRLHGDAEVWSIIGALVSAPIIYRVLVGPLRFLLKPIWFVCTVLLISGLVIALIKMVQEIVQEAR
jgi:hypothetical protein